jgi:hypothetical protein
MKYLKYEDVEHHGFSQYHGFSQTVYSIDWDKGERKFKSPMYNVRTYENGPTEVKFSGQRNPAWRRAVRSAVSSGIDMRMLSGLVDYTLHDPNTGERVKKNSIKTKMFCLDHKWRRAYPAENHTTISLISEHAQPSCDSMLTYTTPNKERYAHLMDRVKDHFALGLTLASLDPALSTKYRYLSWRIRAALVGLQAVPEDLTTEEARTFCLTIHVNRMAALAAIEEKSRNVLEVPYLIIKD